LGRRRKMGRQEQDCGVKGCAIFHEGRNRSLQMQQSERKWIGSVKIVSPEKFQQEFLRE
jgi:hypothetical protein